MNLRMPLNTKRAIFPKNRQVLTFKVITILANRVRSVAHVYNTST